MVKKRVMLTFPPEKVKEPILYNLSHQFRVVTNIQLADIHEDRGWLVIEIEGEDLEIEEGIIWITSMGIRVEPVK